MCDMTTHPNHQPTPPDDWLPASGMQYDAVSDLNRLDLLRLADLLLAQQE